MKLLTKAAAAVTLVGTLAIGLTPSAALAEESTAPQPPTSAAVPTDVVGDTEITITPMAASVCSGLSITTTEQDGIPGPNFWKLLQCFASDGGAYRYAGPIDGVMGYNSWRGMQGNTYRLWPTYFSGPFDGTEATGGWALQAIARTGGYPGPFDGIPGPNTYKAVAGYLNYILVNVWRYE